MKCFSLIKLNFLFESTTNEQKIAVVPGSFKPPHKGHYEMIKHYSKLVGPSGKVLVFVSSPSAKSERKTHDGKVISPELAKRILEIYCKSLGNVEIEIANGSSVRECYSIGKRFNSGTLIFGCSKKDNDIVRFEKLKSYTDERNPDLTVIDPLTTAVDVTSTEDGYISATNFRNVYGNPEEMMKFLPDHLSNKTKQKIINLMLN